jgi:ABC-type amino acid transport system permease subunit
MSPAIKALDLPVYFYITLSLVINSSAYIAEIIRSGIQAVDKGQTEAAKSLGMSNFNVMIRIIMPQAIKNILPALGNEFIMMIKETSLASTFYINELMKTRIVLQSTYFLTWQPLFVIAIIYYVLTSLLSKAVSLLERRLAVSD